MWEGNTVIADEQELDQIWEPYPLQLGAVVRINISNECSVEMESRLHIEQINKTFEDNRKHAHPKAYDKQIGVVIGIEDDPDRRGHRYRVFTIKAISHNNEDLLGADFAGVELEYIERHLTRHEWSFVVGSAVLFGLPCPEYWSIHRVEYSDTGEPQDKVICMGSLLDNTCGRHR